MNYSLTPAQIKVREIVREITENEFKDKAEWVDKEHVYPKENMELLKDLGFWGISIPKEWGGSGGDYLSYIITLEEIARYCATTCVALSAHVSLACHPILKFGTPAQKEKFLKPMAQGKLFGAFGLTEPEAGTDAAAQKTTAVLDGDEWLINGTKVFITNAQEADIYIIFAMTDTSKGLKGISAFILPADTKGFSVGKIEDKMGICGSQTGELIFENVRIPKDYILGKEGMGFKIAMQTLDGGRIGIASQALGIAQGALDEAVKYVKEREQFGRPIGNFQGLQWYIAEMATRTETSRLLIYRAAKMKQDNLPHSKESAMAKWYASEAATYVAHKAIQLHGGYGFTKDYHVERMYRDARITEIYEGTTEVQKMVVSAHVLK